VQDDGRRWEEELHCQQHESLIVCLRRGVRARDGRANRLRTRAVRDAGVVIAAIARLVLLERPVGDAYCDKLDEGECSRDDDPDEEFRWQHYRRFGAVAVVQVVPRACAHTRGNARKSTE
jgi:hypothetical protein